MIDPQTLDLFDGGARPAPAARYPDAPGWKGQATSREAAEGIAPRAAIIRERVLQALAKKPGTPEEIAAAIGVPLLSVRPRFSEALKAALIEKTGERRRSAGGKSALVWRVRA